MNAAISAIKSAGIAARFPILLIIGLFSFACVPPVLEGDSATADLEEEVANSDEVRASFQNTPPVARAGDDIDAVPGGEVVLNATASTDVDRNRLSFVWSQISGSPQVDFDSTAFSSVTTFKVPADLEDSTTLVFSVAVIDGFSVDFDEVRVRITVDE